MKKSTIRPHRKCPCGSKKKYRNCCGKQQNTVNFKDLPEETQKMLRELQLKQKIASQYHQSYLGYTPEIVTTIFKGRRLVSLKGGLVQSDNPERDWQEPAEFLTSHLKTTLGNDWFDNESKKPEKERHIILNWAINSNYEVLDSNKPIESRKLNGSALAYLHLAYDLFVLHNQGHITTKLISRLKDQQNFNGARYELFVLATLIRAGFELAPFDETLGAGKVTECIATHKETGVTFQVEAKTRNVRNILGATKGKAKKVYLYDKLKDAVEKNVNQPYIIFVDLNFPELDVYAENQKIEKVRREHKKLIDNYPNNLPNAIIYTNIPFHYARDDNSAPNTAFGLVKFNNPKFQLNNEDTILNALNGSLGQYKFLPKEFNESEKFAQDIINTIKNHNSKTT